MFTCISISPSVLKGYGSFKFVVLVELILLSVTMIEVVPYVAISESHGRCQKYSMGPWTRVLLIHCT